MGSCEPLVFFNIVLFKTVIISFKVYYYNAKTREAAWSKPENVKIITQSEVEQMAAQAQQTNPTPTGPTTAAQNAVAQGRNNKTVIIINFYFSADLDVVFV